MTDNVDITAGTGTTVASDEIGGTHYQRVKVTWGDDGTATDAAAATPLPVTAVVTGTVAATQSGAWTVTSSGTATVSGTVAATQSGSWTNAATQSGTWTVQPGNTANTTAWKVDGSAVTQPVSGTVTATVSGATLGAGTALVGKVKTKFINAAATALTRPANQTPYSIGDAVSDNATAGSVTAKSVTLSDVNDDTIAIERVRLMSTDTGAQAKSFRMWLYNSDPTASSGVVGGDNAAFSNKQAGFIGTLSGTFRAFSDGAGAVLVPDEGARLVTAPTSGARTVYWQLQTLDAFTPSANSTTFTPTFEGFQGAA